MVPRHKTELDPLRGELSGVSVAQAAQGEYRWGRDARMTYLTSNKPSGPVSPTLFNRVPDQ